MMSYCKKSVCSFLALTNHPMSSVSVDGDYDSGVDQKLSCKCQAGVCSSPPAGGLGLITATTCDPIHKTPNILESTTIKSSSPSATPPSSPPPPSSMASIFKKDLRGIGFLDDIGGGIDGLMSCTESLGFESSDERRFDDDIELCSRERSTIKKVKWRKTGEKKEAKKFPPPLSSLNHNGQPNFFLKSVRKDGRLELTEVRIDRHEILRASRKDGRLRLHFVADEEYEVDEDEHEHEHEREQEEYLEEEKEGKKEEEVEEDNEEESVEERGFHGEGLRTRCHELVAHHRHNHHHSNVWSQQCVPTR
ncbi:FANTASTIC FOUR-LIKE PROTEIN (DUF3049) [Salix purpurea]|uniref:FANTASTIC FOUR-LIKE PROTEIN (DUF3049) n=1 Tax=Salix purpurea TaxID=77065 RepID=A0A9Q0W9C1_SALPP|nr:FANTASTIC FOUR-LIKE PROTEIN (DUF3049) [Salix purpurea]